MVIDKRDTHIKKLKKAAKNIKENQNKEPKDNEIHNIYSHRT